MKIEIKEIRTMCYVFADGEPTGISFPLKNNINYSQKNRKKMLAIIEAIKELS